MTVMHIPVIFRNVSLKQTNKKRRNKYGKSIGIFLHYIIPQHINNVAGFFTFAFTQKLESERAMDCKVQYFMKLENVVRKSENTGV